MGGIHARNVRVFKLGSRDPSGSLGGVCVEEKAGNWNPALPMLQTELALALHLGLLEEKKSA